jgi:nitrogen fixation NifU-like protein
MKYNEKIYKYYNDESHMGSFEEVDNTIGVGLVGAPACGDVMQLQIKIKKENNIDVIKDAKIKVFGCGSAIASSAFAVEILINKTVEEAKKITNEDIAKALDLPTIKTHCSVLAAEAIEEAIEDYYKKNKSETRDEFFINISDEAENYIFKILEKQIKDSSNENAIKIILEQGKCGLSYKIKHVKNFKDLSQADRLFKTPKNLCIFYDESIKNLINGTTMILREEEMKSGIVFVNPNEVGKCGCGMNFKLKDTKTDETECK